MESVRPSKATEHVLAGQAIGHPPRDESLIVVESSVTVHLIGNLAEERKWCASWCRAATTLDVCLGALHGAPASYND